jgi:hypothetical protein
VAINNTTEFFGIIQKRNCGLLWSRWANNFFLSLSQCIRCLPSYFHVIAQFSRYLHAYYFRSILAQLKEKNLVILPGWHPVNVEVIAETPMSDFTQVNAAT